MFKFKIEGKRTLIGLGLVPGNIQKMRAGDDVLVKLESLGILPGHPLPVDVLIMTGESEAAIMDAVKERYGLDVGPDTIVNIDPRTVQ